MDKKRWNRLPGKKKKQRGKLFIREDRKIFYKYTLLCLLNYNRLRTLADQIFSPFLFTFISVGVKPFLSPSYSPYKNCWSVKAKWFNPFFSSQISESIEIDLGFLRSKPISCKDVIGTLPSCRQAIYRLSRCCNDR